MQPAPVVLYAERNLRVEYFRTSQPTSRLLFTFTEHGNRALDGLGYAGKFALENGFDLVSVKSSLDDWYASLPAEVFAAIEAGLAASSANYAWRGCFGSSMGAYASLIFANELRADVALAYSPQYDISKAWDLRWSRSSPGAGLFRTLQSEHVKPSCRHVVVYDPWDPDARHAREFAAVIPPGSLELLEVPYAGHPVGYYLKATGIVRSFPLAVLDRYGAGQPILSKARPQRTEHGEFYFNLAGHCLRRGKLRWSRWAIGQAQLRRPWHTEVLIRSAQIDERLGDLPRAAASAALAVALSPRHPHFAATLARILHRSGRHGAALNQIGAALAIAEGNAPFEAQRKEILAALAASGVAA